MKIVIFSILGVVIVCAIAWVIGLIFYRARMQHYVFAHQLLPAQMFAEPLAVLAPMVSPTGFSPEGREHLLRFREAAGEGHGDKDLVSPDSLTYSMVVLGHPNSTAFLARRGKSEVENSKCGYTFSLVHAELRLDDFTTASMKAMPRTPSSIRG